MQVSKKGPDIVTVRSTSDSECGFQLWWSPIESHRRDSDLSKNSSFKMGVAAHQHQSLKWLDFSSQDYDSSSTQSTSQSCKGTVSIVENALDGQGICFTQLGNNVTQRKWEEDDKQFTLSMSAQNYICPQLQVDCNQSFTQLTAHADQYFNTILSTYGPQAVVMGVMPGRLPLPFDLSTSEPIYVNAKQYHGILRRRQHRAKLEAQNRILKLRKPYLHESRHHHAMRRVRGSGGRFLNTKKLQESKHSSADNCHNVPSSASLHLAVGNVSASEVHQQETYREGNSTTSCSDVTSGSTGDYMYHPPDFSFSSYSSCMGGQRQGGSSSERNYV